MEDIVRTIITVFRDIHRPSLTDSVMYNYRQTISILKDFAKQYEDPKDYPEELVDAIEILKRKLPDNVELIPEVCKSRLLRALACTKVYAFEHCRDSEICMIIDIIEKYEFMREYEYPRQIFIEEYGNRDILNSELKIAYDLISDSSVSIHDKNIEKHLKRSLKSPLDANLLKMAIEKHGVDERYIIAYELYACLKLKEWRNAKTIYKKFKRSHIHIPEVKSICEKLSGNNINNYDDYNSVVYNGCKALKKFLL